MPNSPSQGGSHEAAVKLFKTHFHRVVKNESLSVKQFQSLVTQIEGCLNSRPLGAMTDDAADDLALTPFHFINGAASDHVPVNATVDTKSSFYSKWRHVQLLPHTVRTSNYFYQLALSQMLTVSMRTKLSK